MDTPIELDPSWAAHERADICLSGAFAPQLAQTASWFYKRNITPNMVTGFRTVLIVVVLVLMSIDWAKIPVVRKTGSEFLIAYLAVAILLYNNYLDCVDGYMARTYNQTSALGKYLDLGVDFGFLVGVAVVVRHKFKKSWLEVMLAIGLSLGIGVLLNRLVCHENCPAFLKVLFSTYVFQSLLVFGLTIYPTGDTNSDDHSSSVRDDDDDDDDDDGSTTNE